MLLAARVSFGTSIGDSALAGLGVAGNAFGLSPLVVTVAVLAALGGVLVSAAART